MAVPEAKGECSRFSFETTVRRVPSLIGVATDLTEKCSKRAGSPGCAGIDGSQAPLQFLRQPQARHAVTHKQVITRKNFGTVGWDHEFSPRTFQAAHRAADQAVESHKRHENR